jgi:dipeptidase E
MPIVYPPNLESFGFTPFQINPHYIDTHLEGHAGETREQRILEYATANPNKYVAGLRESCMLLLSENKLQLKGNRNLRVFRNGMETKEYSSKDDLLFLMS